jgi:Flp pilus assembly protein TadG
LTSSNSGGVRRFRRNETGAIAILFALLLIPMLMAVGGGVDFLRAFTVKAAIQAQLDAAALVAGAFKLPDPTNAADSQPRLEAEVRRYMKVNAPELDDIDEIDLVNVTYTPDPAAARHTILLTTSARVETAFLRVIGLTKLNIQVSSKTRRPTLGPVQMAMVLDVTGSMREPAIGAPTRMDALRLAAADLAREVLSPANPEASIAVVPFSEYVNIGNAAAYRSSPPSWLLVPPDRTSCKQVCVKDPNPDRKCFIDGVVPTPCLICSTPTTCPEADRTTTRFMGCVSPRRSAAARVTIDMSVGPSERRYPGNRRSCGVPILKLTNELDDRVSTTTHDVLGYINSIAINGVTTYMPGGLIWAWNLLDPEEPIVPAPPLNLPRTAASLSAVSGRNVVVIMSDGANNAAPWGDVDDTVGTPRRPPNPSPTVADTDAETLSICERMRAAKIEIYAVLFDATTTEANKNTSPSILRACAGNNDRFYVAANTADLRADFKDIAQRLARLAVVE